RVGPVALAPVPLHRHIVLDKRCHSSLVDLSRVSVPDASHGPAVAAGLGEPITLPMKPHIDCSDRDGQAEPSSKGIPNRITRNPRKLHNENHPIVAAPATQPPLDTLELRPSPTSLD